MNEICAFIVGIDDYDQAGWSTAGPCANAVAVTQWLLDLGIPPQNLYLFLDTRNSKDMEARKNFQGRGVNVHASAKFDEIDTFWRKQMPKLAASFSRLFAYWSGHGLADNDGDRIFICRDFTSDCLRNRVFNCSKTLRHLHSPEYQGFKEQIWLADVCANHSKIRITANKESPADFATETKQVAFFATPEGKYATGGEGLGVFTELALKELQKFKGWPDLNKFSDDMEATFRGFRQQAFRVSYKTSHNEVVANHFVGPFRLMRWIIIVALVLALIGLSWILIPCRLHAVAIGPKNGSVEVGCPEFSAVEISRAKWNLMPCTLVFSLDGRELERKSIEPSQKGVFKIDPAGLALGEHHWSVRSDRTGTGVPGGTGSFIVTKRTIHFSGWLAVTPADNSTQGAVIVVLEANGKQFAESTFPFDTLRLSNDTRGHGTGPGIPIDVRGELTDPSSREVRVVLVLDRSNQMLSPSVPYSLPKLFPCEGGSASIPVSVLSGRMFPKSNEGPNPRRVDVTLTGKLESQ